MNDFEFYREGVEDQPYHFIARIEGGIIGAKTVQAEFEPAFDTLATNAELFYRRWAK